MVVLGHLKLWIVHGAPCRAFVVSKMGVATSN